MVGPIKLGSELPQDPLSSFFSLPFQLGPLWFRDFAKSDFPMRPGIREKDHFGPGPVQRLPYESPGKGPVSQTLDPRLPQSEGCRRLSFPFYEKSIPPLRFGGVNLGPYCRCDGARRGGPTRARTLCNSTSWPCYHSNWKQLLASHG